MKKFIGKTEDKKSFMNKYGMAIISGIVGILIIVLVGSKVFAPKFYDSNFTESEIIGIAKEAILDELVSPSSAKFQPRSELEGIYNEDKEEVTVYAYVDSDNRVGANVRTQFRVIIDYKEGAVKSVKALN